MRLLTLRFLVVLLPGLLGLLPASALAVAPTTTTEQFYRHPLSYVNCGSFHVIGDFYITRTTVIFYSQDGTPIREVLHIQVRGTVANSVTGTSLPTSRDGILIIDLLTGTQTVDGQVVRVNAPGEGVVLQDIGRFIQDANGNLIFEAGPHEFQDYLAGDTSGVQDLCAALS